MLFSWMGRRNAGDGWVQLFHGSWHLTWAVGLGSCWGCPGLFRFGVAQHPEQAFPVSFQDHSSSSGENGSVQWPTVSCGLLAPGLAMRSGLLIVDELWGSWAGLTSRAAVVPGPLDSLLGCQPKLCWSHAACLGILYPQKWVCDSSPS